MMKNMKTSPIDAFLALPDEEKERQFREFDKEFVADTFRPLTPAQRALWERAKRRGRPTIGAGAKVISLSVERRLLSEADARAKALGISRAEFVARGLRAMLARKPRKSQAA
jgi:S-adenosylmethionine:diacylglycerol 3-amino-3-carboxypropyl transferase